MATDIHIDRIAINYGEARTKVGSRQRAIPPRPKGRGISRNILMNFRAKRRDNDDIFVDFIPLIDILLVVLIFITATTTFSRLQEIPVELPSAGTQRLVQDSHVLVISQDGQYALDGRFLSQTDHSVAEALSALQDKTALLIYADANARHATVVHALESARNAKFEQISFATQE